ncbi:MAG: aminotransferase class V-fold PLP-dependent enzyme [Rhizobiales bacterium]|nr:aminotransferase class V-fold PLP-dependent enzyme [Hyphomicrobiales bacterium]
MTERAYLDWNATAPLRPQARAAMVAAMETVGNPSSVHTEGRAARQILDEARERVAAAVGAEPRDVIFTSGGSEANALALSRSIEHLGAPCAVAIASDIEHVSVLAGGDFETVERFGAGRDGVASMDDLQACLRAGSARGAKPLVALMLANNETGVIQSVREAAELVHGAGGLLHVDAVQALGKISLDIKELGADLLAISAHKVGGPMGVGALIVGSEGVHVRGSRFGGGQERSRRGGTENVAGIAGFGAALLESTRDLDGEAQRLSGLRARLESGLKAIWPQTIIFGERAPRVANTLQFAVPGIKAQIALMALDLDGIAVSSGSACSSGTMKFSEVVRSMGYELEVAESAVRVSMGWTTTEAEIDCFLDAWRKLSQSLLKRREIAA